MAERKSDPAGLLTGKSGNSLVQAFPVSCFPFRRLSVDFMPRMPPSHARFIETGQCGRIFGGVGDNHSMYRLQWICAPHNILQESI